jgi:hypothetical protein
MARLGDFVAACLEGVGITKARASRVLGRDCGCAKRQENMNQWGDSMQLRIAQVLHVARFAWQTIRHNRITARIEIFLRLQKMAFSSLFFSR